MAEKRGVKCSLCGKRGFSDKSPYCRDCSYFCARLTNERFSPEVCESLKNCVRRDKGFFCQYTGQELDVFDYKSAYFLEFDHVVPGDPSEIVTTSAWFNEMKGDLLLKELKGSVVQLFNFWFKGIPIKKKKFRYWFRLIQKAGGRHGQFKSPSRKTNRSQT